MGTFNNFGELKQFADKMVKFKQGVLIRAARAHVGIEPEHFEIVKEGACASFTMAWILQQLGGPVRFHRSDYVASASDMTSIRNAAAMVPAYVEYAKNFDAHKNALKLLADEYELDLEEPPTVHWDFPSAFRQARGLGRGKATYISIDVETTDETEAHALAFFTTPQGRVHFFDSNVGEYALHDVSIEPFFIAYTDIYATRLNWKFGKIESYQVTRSATLMAAQIFKEAYGD